MARDARWCGTPQFLPIVVGPSLRCHTGLSQKVIDEFRAYGTVFDSMQEDAAQQAVDDTAELSVTLGDSMRMLA